MHVSKVIVYANGTYRIEEVGIFGIVKSRRYSAEEAINMVRNGEIGVLFVDNAIDRLPPVFKELGMERKEGYAAQSEQA